MSNQFTFTCPVFNVDTKMAHCEQLRHKIYRGEEIGVRKGCQACVASGKCPVAREITRSIHQQLNTVEHYHSVDEPKKGKLRAQVLEEILPVIVQEQHLNKFAVSAGERDLIMTANQRIEAQLGSAPRKDLKPLVDRTRKPIQASRTKLPEQPKVDLEINKAAATGDMSAAINQAA